MSTVKKINYKCQNCKKEFERCIVCSFTGMPSEAELKMIKHGDDPCPHCGSKAIYDTYNAETDEICPKCNSEMIIMRGRFGPFLSCTNFPKCKNAEPVPRCSECGRYKEIVKDKNGNKNWVCFDHNKRTLSNKWYSFLKKSK